MKRTDSTLAYISAKYMYMYPTIHRQFSMSVTEWTTGQGNLIVQSLQFVSGHILATTAFSSNVEGERPPITYIADLSEDTGGFVGAWCLG